MCFHFITIYYNLLNIIPFMGGGGGGGGGGYLQYDKVTIKYIGTPYLCTLYYNQIMRVSRHFKSLATHLFV